ncbi:MAG TPA: hypothetical protein VF812_15440 [Ktedonobacterales bacterium]
MSIVDILPLLLVVVFWMLLFVFTFWFTRIALHAPTEAEVEAQQIESGHATSAH